MFTLDPAQHPRLTRRRSQLPLLPAAPPWPVLYGRGDLALLDQIAVAVVGTREPSAAGVDRAARCAGVVAELDRVLVSGLARGVDTVALRAADAAGGHLIAVLGTALDRASPRANAPLQRRIGERHLLLTEHPPGTPVRPWHFARRNRLLAAAADAAVVVEAADASGTLHLVRACRSWGRPLLIPRAVAREPGLVWPAALLDQPDVYLFDGPDELRSLLLNVGVGPR